MNKKGITAAPTEWFLDLAKPAERPMTTIYEHIIPRTDVRNKGRRPTLSHDAAATAARMRFQRASEKSIVVFYQPVTVEI